MIKTICVGGILLCCLAVNIVQAQTKIGRIDVAAMMESLPEAYLLRNEFQAYLSAEAGKMRMQWLQTKTEQFAKFKHHDSSAPEARYKSTSAAAETESEKRFDAARLRLLQREAELLAPLLQKVDAAIQEVRQELHLDILLRTNDCPFDRWGQNRAIDPHRHTGDAFGMQFISAYPIRPKDPCFPMETVLFVRKDAIDIAPFVLEKLSAQAGK